MEDFYAFVRSAWVIWMMALFVIIVAWVLWPSNREKFRRAAQIPLSEDKQSADAVSDRPDQTSSADRKNRI